jgi:hypothetical protein
MRSIRPILLPVWVLTSLLVASSVEAQWIPTGVPVCGDECRRTGGHISIPDGAGGAYVAWRDRRDPFTTDTDIYLQRITGAGTIAPGWPTGGLPICACAEWQNLQALIADGEGGAFVVWQDARNGATTSADIYAQRVRPDGTLAPGWPDQGAPLSRDPSYQFVNAVAADGAGGLFAVWEDTRDFIVTGFDLYAQHLTATGEPAPGWPADGVPVCTAAGDQITPRNHRLVLDGAGGVVVVWVDARRYPPTEDIYAQRRLADGTIAPGWAVNGNPLALDRTFARVLADGAGGFYVGSQGVPAPPDYDTRFWLQRFTLDGAVAPGWPQGGVAVVTTPGDREWSDFALDGAGGVLLCWLDYRLSPYGTGETYAMRVGPDGTLPPGWMANGVRVSDETYPYHKLWSWIAPDGNGGAYVAWEYETPLGQRSNVQQLTASGAVAPGWPAWGRLLAPTGHQDEPTVVTDGAGGAIVVWEEGDPANQRFGLYAQRFLVDGPVAVELALARVDATAERVVLVWQGAGAGAIAATVERRTEAGAWGLLGPAALDGPDALIYEDRAVEPGARYAYRLAYTEQGATRHTAESWVEVPRALKFALEGFTPNPSSTPATVGFTLPDGAPAMLEVFDLAGRRVMAREVGSLGPGRHVIQFAGAAIAPGVYVMRLRQSGAVGRARGVLGN